MRAEIDGQNINSDADFHAAISSALPFPAFYGKNLDALWDVLTGMLERPVLLVWKNSSASEAVMPERFKQIIEVLRAAESADREAGLTGRFELVLE